MHGFLSFFFSSSYYNRLRGREKGCFRGKEELGPTFLMGGAFSTSIFVLYWKKEDTGGTDVDDF